MLRTKSMILGSFTWNLKWVLPGDRQTKLPCLFSDGPGEWVQGASTRATCAVAVLSQNDPSVPPRTHADSYRLALVTTGAFLGNHSKTGKPPGDRRCHGESRQPCCHSRPPLPPPSSPDPPSPLNTSASCHHTKTLPGRREGFLTSYT